MSRLPLLAALIILPAYVIAITPPAVGMFHDDGLYLVTAKALAEGEGYRIASLPEPIPQTKYPILFPAILALLWKLFPRFPENLVLLRLVSPVCAALWGWACFRLLRPRTKQPWMVAWVVLFTLASPWTVYVSASVLPDTLFALLSVVGLLLLTRAEGGWKGAGLAGLVGGAAFLTRTVGVALIAAGVVSLAWRRQWKQLAVFVLICGMVCGPWMLWQRWQPDPTDPVIVYYSKANYASGHILGGYSTGQAVKVVLTNAMYLVVGFATMLGLPADEIGFALCLWITGLVLAGYLGSWRQDGPSAVNLWVLFYTGILVLWVWPPHRYSMPLIPFLLWYAGRSLHVLVRKHPLARPMAVLLVAGVALAMAVSLTRIARETLRTGTPSFTNLDSEKWRHVRGLAEWIREHTEPGAVVTANLDPILSLLSERKAIRAFAYDPFELMYSAEEGRQPVGSLEDLRKHLIRHEIRYIAVTPMHIFSEAKFHHRNLYRLVQEQREAFRVVHREQDPEYFILAVEPAFLSYKPPRINHP